MDRSFGTLSSGRWKWLVPLKYIDGMSTTRSNSKLMAFSKLVTPSRVQKNHYRKDAINDLSDRISSGRPEKLIRKLKYMRQSLKSLYIITSPKQYSNHPLKIPRL